MQLLNSGIVQSSIEGVEKPEIPMEVRRKWQRVVDLMAEIIGVPSGLIMKVKPPYIQVFISNAADDNPYQVGDKEHLAGLYCEKVIESRDMLLVPDALKDEKWKHNPDVKLGMISYLGLPLLWPDGQPFGTICVLDNKENEYSELYIDLMREFKDVVETDLQSLCQVQRLRELADHLRTREEKIRSLFNLMADPVVIVDGKGKFLTVNDRVEEVTGFKREELLGKNFLRTKIVTAKSKAILMKNLAKRMMGIHVAPYEVEVLTKDGKKLPFEINATKIEYEGKPADLVVFRDITERKKAEMRITESEEKFRNIFESANDCMAYLDKSGRILDVNRKAVQVFGGSRKELLGKHFTRIGVFSPRDIPTLMSNFAKVLAGKNATLDICIKNKKGQKIPLECSTSLIKTDDKLAGIMVIARDITERKRAEEKIRKEKEFTSSLLKGLKEGFAVVDHEGKQTLVNAELCKMTGYSEKELLNQKPPFKYWAEEGLKEINETFEKTLRGIEGEYELIFKRKDGERFIALVSPRKTVDSDGNTIFFATVKDITERKHMEKKLEKYSQRLEELVEKRTRQLKETQERLLKSERLAAIGELATMVGHDLKNPLQSIENATYYLNNELPRLSPSVPIRQKALEMLQVINDSVEYADKIIRDLQDFSATKRPILEKTDVNTIVKEILSQVEAPENVELITELSHLPEIKADKDMIKRVFLNLTVNGIQAMENGGKLKVSTKKTNGFVEVSFKDTGLGMSKENIEKIFTPFFTTKAKGMGMGLAICKKFVECHGGNIDVESEEGKGTTFTIKLPIP